MSDCLISKAKINMDAIKIAFIHPDLGIGGAERLVVDAATALQETTLIDVHEINKVISHVKGHRKYHVTVFTSHHDHQHCFPETRTQLNVRVYGDFIRPPAFLNLAIFFATLRGVYLALKLVLVDYCIRGEKFDVLFVDQLAAPIPILRLTGAKILFYCHYPDKLLQSRQSTGLLRSLLKWIYRWPFDMLEEFTTSMADKIVSNSVYTSTVIRDTFKTFMQSHLNSSEDQLVEVLYPGIRVSAYDSPVDFMDSDVVQINAQGRRRILSVNRFERKKNLQLAIHAFVHLRSKCSVKEFYQLQLILAGGYDPRNSENLEYHNELQELCEQLKLTHSTYFRDDPEKKFNNAAMVLFIPSFTDKQRQFLFKSSECLIYTPENEHFGIVPVEAMYNKLPVVALNSGGPKETVVDGVTGFLCDGQYLSTELVDKLYSLLFQLSKESLKSMGESSCKRVVDKFTLSAFSSHLNVIIDDMLDGGGEGDSRVMIILSLMTIIVGIIYLY